MEATYVKATVGPIVTEALTSLLLHVPRDTHTSSYSTTIDPISYIGTYLLNHSKSTHQQSILDAKFDAQDSLIKQYKDSQAKQVKHRENLGDGLVQRLSTLNRVDINNNPSSSSLDTAPTLVAAATADVPATIKEDTEPTAPVESGDDVAPIDPAPVAEEAPIAAPEISTETPAAAAPLE